VSRPALGPIQASYTVSTREFFPEGNA